MLWIALFLYLLVVLPTTELELVLIFYHLFGSPCMCRLFSGGFFFPSLPSQLSSIPATTAQGVTQLLMRAAIDFGLTPVSERGRRGGASPSEEPFASVERAYVTTQLQKAHTGIIFTLLHYFPYTPPRVGVKKCIL